MAHDEAIRMQEASRVFLIDMVVIDKLVIDRG